MKGTSLLGKKYGTRGPYSQGESGQRQNPDANKRKDKTTSFNFKVKSGTNQSATTKGNTCNIDKKLHLIQGAPKKLPSARTPIYLTHVETCVPIGVKVYGWK
jgi:hypothetical protein